MKKTLCDRFLLCCLFTNDKLILTSVSVVSFAVAIFARKSFSDVHIVAAACVGVGSCSLPEGDVGDESGEVFSGMPHEFANTAM